MRSRSQILIFPDKYLTDPASSVEKIVIFPQLFGANSYHKSRDFITINQGTFSGLSIFLPICSVLKIPNCLNYYSFMVSNDIQQSKYSNFFLLNCFAVLGPLHFYIILESSCQLNNNPGISTALLTSLLYWNILIHEHGVSIYLCLL